MDNVKQFNDALSFKDDGHKIGLRGHVKIELEDRDTKQKTLWYEEDNIIPISGMQWILMKMFNLHLDSNHGESYDQPGQDTSTVIPDLNNGDQLSIGINPDDYSVMAEDIPSTHFIQGFMVGNGGTGEDSISTKNTNYCFIRLRDPIPFQESSGDLDPSIAGKYLGVSRTSTNKQYFIKKFDDRPHVYHNWWKEGQRWDYLDPITQSDLGPSPDSTAKTNRIETYVEVGMSIDTRDGDCVGFFSNNSQDAVLNELGLVAYDAAPGTRSIIEKLYETHIKKFLNVLYSNDTSSVETNTELIELASEIYTVMNPIVGSITQTNINSFLTLIKSFADASPESEIDYESARNTLNSDTNIEVSAMYNTTHQFVYETDKFLYYMADEAFSDLTVDEAQRIKLITYYTFKSIPLQDNWKILISYRIYAN